MDGAGRLVFWCRYGDLLQSRRTGNHYDQSGNRYLTAEERARAAAAIAAQVLLIDQQERLAKQEAEQKAQRLAERLRSLGINPDEM